MLRRLCRTLVVSRHFNVTAFGECRNSLKVRVPVCLDHRKFRHEIGYNFLKEYPNAFKHSESFGIKVQPFSINAPHFYLRNFVNELGHNLNIPYIYEDGYSAAMCLELICHKREKGSLLITEAIEGITIQEWHELYIAIDDEIPFLNERTMVSLISFYHKVGEFNKACFEKIYSRFVSVLKRRKDIPTKDLSLWSEILLENDECLQPKVLRLLEQIWKKIESNKGTLTADDLLLVYQALPVRYIHMFDTFFQDLKRELPSMKIYDIFMIGMEIRTKSERTQEFKLMIELIRNKLKSQMISVEELQVLLSNFIAREYVDELLLDILSRHLQKDSFSDKEFMKIVLEYSTLSRFCDENILERACTMFTEAEEDYNYKDLILLLRAIGTLNYTPINSYEFFNKVEAFIHREVLLMKPETLLELVEYLLYVDRPMFNLKELIFSYTFQDLIKDYEKEDPSLYRACLVRLNLIYEAFLEIGYDPFPRLTISRRDLFQRLNPLDYIGESVYSDVVQVLKRFVISENIGHFPRPTFQENYIEIQFDPETGRRLKIRDPRALETPVYRKALFVVTDKDFCRMYGSPVSDHMLGREAANVRVLENQGVEVVIMRKIDILSWKKANMKDEELRQFLRPNPGRFQRFKEDLQRKQEEDKKLAILKDSAHIDDDNSMPKDELDGLDEENEGFSLDEDGLDEDNEGVSLDEDVYPRNRYWTPRQ